MPERKPLIAANWKMHKTAAEAAAFVTELAKAVGKPADREVLIAPPFTALHAVRDPMKRAGFILCAQNCHFEEKGAFTGEISVPMVKDAGCAAVILGHSERRHVFGETDGMVARKVAAAQKGGLLPILCVGEVLAERERGETVAVVGRQLGEALRGLTAKDAAGLVVAYEPVWAIGTGKTATPQQAQETHAFIRERLGELFDKALARRVRILYGGSVKPDNVDALMACPDIDGLLVGGASLEAASFSRIVLFQGE